MNTDISRVSLPLPAQLLEQMKDTPQNPRYHAEGSVYNHTCLVLDQYETHHSQFGLDENQKQMLRWACIVHDLGKPVVTRWVRGRWSAKGHEAAGVPIARALLFQEKSLSDAQRQQILSLVRYHSAPLQMGLHGADLTAYKLLATRIDLRLLGLFAWFDLHGRICVDQETVYNIIDHFLNTIVPRVEYELGTFEEIQATFGRAGIQQKNALWYACRQRNLPLVEKLLALKQDTPGQGRTFQVVLPVVYGPDQHSKWLQEQFPAHKVFSFELPAKDSDSIHVRTNHLRTARHFVSVFGKEGKPLLIEGPWQDQAYRDELVEFIRQQGGMVRLLEIEDLRPDDWKPHAIAAHYPDAWIQEQPHLIHPWEFHSRELVGMRG